jgi:transposase
MKVDRVGSLPLPKNAARRQRLNTKGNRKLNHAIHVVAITQVRNDYPGRDFFLDKQAEGK